ncbi:gamma-glutamylcyclotransferase family protein [Mucilaginibacter antarcticus]|uniref:Gamma-glutamylcyclotransferase n=1 Tax=Mucilaginibacter antarcticus TaxID=1855725 RepID=A0ABW5XSW4_9SPHI
MINDLLFVYGTLLNTDNEFARYLKSNAKFHGAGKFIGRLYDIGEYPGATTGTTQDYEIKGDIYQLTSFNALVILDNYEGYGADQDQPNLYIRELLPVKTTAGIVDCWIYLYNLPVDGLVEIKGGDYQTYLKQK